MDGDGSRSLDLLQRLADASLVVADEHRGQMRYHLLETVREYAADRLRELDGDATAQRHAEWCLALAEEAEPELSGEHQSLWFATLETEHDNLRSALAFLSTADRALRLRLTVALSRFWYVRGYLAEGSRWLDDALADADERACPAAPPRAHGCRSARVVAGRLRGRDDASRKQALDAARRGGEPRFVANALSNLGAIVLAAGDHARAGVVLEEAVGLAREVGDERIAALAINNLGDLALTTGDYGAPDRSSKRATPCSKREATPPTSHARSSTREQSTSCSIAPKPPRADFREGLSLAHAMDDKEDIAWCLEGLASLAAAEGAGELASILLGAAGGLLKQIGADFKPFERQLHEATRARAERLCGHDGYRAVRAEGEALPLAQAIVLATDGRPAS